MELLNICILKKQIYCEFDNFFKTSSNIDVMNHELFIQYITNLIFFYNSKSNNIYLENINLLEKIKFDYDNNNNNILLKITIGKINCIDVLSDLLIFFLGRTNTQNFIYSS